jgi:hypothetical protein
MIAKGNVTFRHHVADIDTINDSADDNKQPMEICEVTYPDGKVAAFPADSVSPEDGRKYRDIYAGKYQAFKNGDPDADRVRVLEGEIATRQAELDSFKNRRAPDDKRVQENLGYGEVGQHEPFDHMTKAELADWIAKNSDETIPGDANKDDLVRLAKKVERKQKAAA